MLALIIVSISKLNYAQVSVPANAGGPANYVGWNSLQLQDLTIKHENNRFINFYTNAGAGGFNNPRMRILSGNLTGNGATTDGFVGIGDFNFFAANAQRMTLIGTAGANQGFVGINTNSPTYTLTVNGTLAANKIIITTENKEQDLLALIAQLQSEVAELREKMTLQRN